MLSKATPFHAEYITMDEVAQVTGFKESYIRDLAKKAGITRIGQKAFDRNDFFLYWKYRSFIEDSPKRTGETSRMRQLRINKGWRSFVAETTSEGVGA